MLPFDPRRIQTPAYVIDLGRFRQNLAKLAQVQKDADCSILLALKGFAAFSTFEWVKATLSGASASSVAEARLAREYIDKEVHVYAPAFSAEDIQEIATVADHVVFNSVSQLERFSASLKQAQRNIEIGLRINPEHRETEVALYDPCAPGSPPGQLPGLPSAALPHQPDQAAAQDPQALFSGHGRLRVSGRMVFARNAGLRRDGRSDSGNLRPFGNPQKLVAPREESAALLLPGQGRQGNHALQRQEEG